MNEMELKSEEMVVVSLEHSPISRYFPEGFETNI
jgi:hypothetical protein